MTRPDPASGAGTPDLSACDQEPIRIPGSIQPHGALLVAEPDSLRVLQAAVGNPAALAGGDPLGRPLPEVLVPEAAKLLDRLGAVAPGAGPLHLGLVRGGHDVHHLIAHRSAAGLILEVECGADGEPGSFDTVFPHLRDVLDALQRSDTVEELAALAAREVRRLTGLDRTLIYRFDAEWHGAVIAEDRNDRLPSYLGLRFPASDIPAQARALYRQNRLRLIADANYTPVPLRPALHPLTGEPTDLGFAVLRSVSPVHLEYMRNMGTMASMSISLLREGRLWGLISCHNRAPARVPYHVRSACDFIGQLFSLQLAAREAADLVERRNRLRAVQTRLLAAMAAAEHFAEGLLANPDDLLALTDARGAAVVSGDTCTRVGETPAADDILRLVAWLAGGPRRDLFATDSLTAQMPDAARLVAAGSGVLAVSISQLYDSYLLWFRPEVIRTVTWGGDPGKSATVDPAGPRLHPRRSFAHWRETVRLRATPWEAAEIEAAAELRAAIVDIVLRKAEELAALSERLASINKELEAFSYSVSHDLRAPFRHIVGYAQLLKRFEGDRLTERGNRYIDTIVESALSAGTLVDNLLNFSQMGRATLTPMPIDMNALVAEVRARLTIDDGAHRVIWRVADLPPTRADPIMLRLVVQNLLDNAIKFSSAREPAEIEVACTANETEYVYSVRDNGAGFDMAYVGKLFGVFQRLHRVEEFAGTGIGLANVKRIVERHGGRVWAEGRVGKGATFFFSLPRTGAAQDG